MRLVYRPLALFLTTTFSHPSRVSTIALSTNQISLFANRNLLRMSKSSGAPKTMLNSFSSTSFSSNSSNSSNSPSPGMSRVALLQFPVSPSKEKNHATAISYIEM